MKARLAVLDLCAAVRPRRLFEHGCVTIGECRALSRTFGRARLGVGGSVGQRRA